MVDVHVQCAQLSAGVDQIHPYWIGSLADQPAILGTLLLRGPSPCLASYHTYYRLRLCLQEGLCLLLLISFESLLSIQ